MVPPVPVGGSEGALGSLCHIQLDNDKTHKVLTAKGKHGAAKGRVLTVASMRLLLLFPIAWLLATAMRKVAYFIADRKGAPRSEADAALATAGLSLILAPNKEAGNAN